jgi:GNAT superfamily N-acetyltransferase
MNRTVIRPLTRTHGKAFLSLVNALADYEGLKRPDRAAQSRLLKNGLGKNKRFKAFLAFTEGKAVGYAIVFESYSSFRARPTLYLEDLFVLSGFRHRRIGYALFRKCLLEARRGGCGRMEWMVLDWNRPAIRFYRKFNAVWMKEWKLFRINL